MSIPSELCDSFRLELAKRFEPYGWKYLKSVHELKKQVGDVVFQVGIDSSWSNSADSARVRMLCMCWCKSISKTYTQDATVMHFKFSPTCQDSFEWWELITPKGYAQSVEDAAKQFERTMLPLTERFETDYRGTVLDLAQKGFSNAYISTTFCRIQYAAHVLGEDTVRQAAAMQYAARTERQKASFRDGVQSYLERMEEARKFRDHNGYMFPSDLMYMVDHGIVTQLDDGTVSFEGGRQHD